MNADHSSQQDTTLFPFFPSSEETAGTEVVGPTRFARALKRVRIVRGWTQAMLAEHVSITRRSIVIWETGDRIPGIGMVVILLDTLFPDEPLSLHHELLCAYIADEVEREAQRQQTKRATDDLLLQQRLQRVIEQILALPRKQVKYESESRHHHSEKTLDTQKDQPESPQPASHVESQPALEPLFILMTQLQRHPELIQVACDFIREMVADE